MPDSNNTEKIKELHYKRGNFKTKVTLFQRFINGLSPDNIAETDLINLQQRLAKFQLIYDQFDDIQNQLDRLNPDCEDNLEEREQFENNYYSLLSQGQQLVNLRKPPTEIANVSQTAKSANVKLPKLTIPSFDGSFINWRTFHDTFVTIIHNNSDLTDVQKLCYLRSALKNEPANLISSLDTSDTNYSIAWKLLQERYNNKRRIIYNHVREILDVSNVSKGSHVTLRHLIDTIQKHLNCLKAMNQPVESWNALLIPMLLPKLDFNTIREWESFLNKKYESRDDIPTVEEFIKFLNDRQGVLESLSINQSSSVNFKPFPKHKTDNVSAFATTATVDSHCASCKGKHYLYQCEEFLKLPVNKRIERTKELHLCLNCLKKGHNSFQCKNAHTCKSCHRKHNTLLHISNSEQEQSKGPNRNSSEISSRQVQAINESSQASTSLASYSYSTLHKGRTSSQVLLSTACVNVKETKAGNIIIARALLDSASQSNFISEELCKKLNLKRHETDVSIVGISQTPIKTMARVEIKIYSRYNHYSVTLSCLVIPKITDNLPSSNFNANILDIPSNLVLADPTYNKQGKIDILIGASNFWELLSVGQHQLGTGKPTLHKTKLGWVISGNLSPNEGQIKRTLAYLSLNKLQDEVSKFWEINECIERVSHLSAEEKYCEKMFNETTQRATNGKFIVRIPLKPNYSSLDKYVKFMYEYKQLNHMTEIEDTLKATYYLPHHAVLRDSLTTKLRVVFDGSCKTDTGISLNDIMLTGKIMQSDLFSIILRFRLHPYVVTADISSMFRQVVIHSDDRHLQNIVWRENVDEPLKAYQLNTITYGTKSGPYLATRCLYQLALDFENSYPSEAQIIKNDFYIDDLITGCDSIEDLRVIRSNIKHILSTAGFILRKWCSNVHTQLFQSDKETIEHEFVQLGDNTIKTLGIRWEPISDVLYYKFENLKIQNQVTKRTILAITAQLFDPLGLLAPIIIPSKLIIQELWHLNITWDESVPTNLYTRWIEFRDNLKHLKNIKLPRYVCNKNPNKVELHGFSDASERAYGANVYIRTITDGKISIFLLAAKSRVAPLKNITLPKLELNAAVLLAQLIHKIRSILTITINEEYLWCDSMITLSWIKTSPSKWKTYVANRVSEIQTCTNINDWHHIKSADNPADLISRGLKPQSLLDSRLWWKGPHFLSSNKELPTDTFKMLNNVTDAKRVTFTTTIEYDIFSKISSLRTLINVSAYCYRFYDNTKKILINKNSLHIDPTEREEVLKKLIKVAQSQSFPTEIKSLLKNYALKPNSVLLCLKPFIDKDGLLRVGGRLTLSDLNYSAKHQLILPKHHILTKLIAENEHVRLLHCGSQTLLNSLRERYWPLSGRNLSKKIIHQCVKCFKANPKISNIYMGNLPKLRTTPTPPFYNSGVDYAGPFKSRDRRARGYKIYKCLFVCLSTKALHLELVSELSTECFLAALKRFVSRRGKPNTIFSDNGTNFAGANRQLIELYQFLENSATNIIEETANANISWKFIPANSPHFGGVWEAGVKAVKMNMKRILGDSILTFEQYTTLLTQIEAVLNSRPLSPLSTDPNDVNPLTPAHFLIGRSLVAIADHNLVEAPNNRLNHYQQLQAMVQHFWKRWQKEYLHGLQMRNKWRKPTTPIKVGDLVTIVDDNLPTCTWKMGRVIQLHPGKDNEVRVVTIKTATSEIKRAINKVCVLPLSDN
ncbi:uncharacterized protein LOC116174520 [Photinus pyralis]|uniref:uncharacterized protein LOC116174520 n=1 Tax=Photinus pyralis TaxID=7054 RepID=UPI0012674C5D|nr:uncharacterized protein LOC116174520 [Photinus pyralis]